MCGVTQTHEQNLQMNFESYGNVYLDFETDDCSSIPVKAAQGHDSNFARGDVVMMLGCWRKMKNTIWLGA